MIGKWLQNVDGNLSGYFHYFAGSGMAIDEMVMVVVMMMMMMIIIKKCTVQL